MRENLAIVNLGYSDELILIPAKKPHQNENFHSNKRKRTSN